MKRTPDIKRERPTPIPKETIDPGKKTESDIVQIQNLLEDNKTVRVIVGIRGNQYTSPEYQENDAKKKEEVKKVLDKVLATLTDKDIQEVKRFSFIPFFTGSISRTGFEKLMKNEDVTSVELEKPDFPL